MPRAYGRLFILRDGNSEGFVQSFVTERTGYIGNTFWAALTRHVVEGVVKKARIVQSVVSNGLANYLSPLLLGGDTSAS